MEEQRTTPLRSTYGLGGVHAVRLRSTELDYLDGGERAVLEILRSSTDLSSLSDELATKGDRWPRLTTWPLLVPTSCVVCG